MSQIDLFAQNQVPVEAEPISFEEQTLPKVPGERWLEEISGDEFIYVGNGRLESLIAERVVLVKGKFFHCQTLGKKLKLISQGDPNHAWQSLLEEARQLAPNAELQLHEWLSEEESESGRDLTWKALRLVEKKFQALKRKRAPKNKVNKEQELEE